MNLKKLFAKKNDIPAEKKEKTFAENVLDNERKGNFSALLNEMKKAQVANRDKAIKSMFPRTIDNIQATVKDNATGRVVAMDSGIGLKNLTGYNDAIPDQVLNFISQGFIGWQACALLKQNWLIDRACSIPAQDAIAPGYQVTFANNDETEVEDDEDFLKEFLQVSVDDFGILDICVKSNVTKKVFGSCLIIPNIEGADYENPFNIDGVKPHSYKGFSVVEPMWTVPELDFDATSNPASKNFYTPTWYRINGNQYQRIRYSWVIKLINSSVPDILKPTYYYGGVPLTQQIYERVYCAERCANEAPLLAMTKRLLVAGIDLENAMANPADFTNRMAALSQMRDNWGVYFKNEGSDQLQQLETSLADFDALIMTQYQLVASIAQMPAVKLLKLQPKGFNATGEFEDKDYKQALVAIQENDWKQLLSFHNQLLMKSKYQKDTKLIVKFNEIDTPTEKESAEVRGIDAQTAVTYINGGVLSPQEVREHISTDPDSDYSFIDASDDNGNDDKDDDLNIDEIINKFV